MGSPASESNSLQLAAESLESLRNIVKSLNRVTIPEQLLPDSETQNPVVILSLEQEIRVLEVIDQVISLIQTQIDSSSVYTKLQEVPNDNPLENLKQEVEDDQLEEFDPSEFMFEQEEEEDVGKEDKDEEENEEEEYDDDDNDNEDDEDFVVMPKIRKRRGSKLANQSGLNKKSKKKSLVTDYGSNEVQRNMLKSLIKKICLWSPDLDVPDEYDVLQGLEAHYYGLCKPHCDFVKPYVIEIIFLSLESPVFLRRKDCVDFFARLFRQPNHSIRLKVRQVYKFFEQGGTEAQYKKGRFPKSSKVLKQFLFGKDGLQAYNPFSPEETFKHHRDALLESNIEVKGFDDLLKTAPSSRRNKPVPNFFTQQKNRARKHDHWETLGSKPSPVLKWMFEANQNLLPVTVNNKAFASQNFLRHHARILPSLVMEHTFAIVAIAHTDSTAKQQDAAILCRLARSPGADPNNDFDNLYRVMTESLGLSYHDIFRNAYSIPLRDNNTLEDHYFRPLNAESYAKLEQLDQEQLKEKLEEANSEIYELAARKEHVQQIDFEINSTMILRFGNPDFDFSKVNNISVLMGQDCGHVTMRTLMSEESYKGSFTKKRISGITDSNETLPFILVDLLCTFHGFTTRNLFSTINRYREKHLLLRKCYSKQKTITEIMEKKPESTVCEHCGKVFENNSKTNTVGIARHIKRCMLERANCDCPDIKFKSPCEKRRHMLLYHSNYKYYTCPECPYISKQQSVVDYHFQHYHGLPGQEEACDLCNKGFKSKNNLRIHRFNHESYLCLECNSAEIIGRIPYRNHMKKYHSFGFHCDLCGKCMATKVQLDNHKKLSHEEAPWMQ